MLEERGGARPTLDDVAAHAGVSRATVSRVVNGGAGVRAALVGRVRTSIEELGYVPNYAARSLVTKRHGAVAVVVAEPERTVFTDPFFARNLRGISTELSAADTQLVLLLVEDAHEYQRIGRYLAGNHVDGVLVFSLHRDDPLPELARRAALPAVYGGRPWSPTPGTLYVDADNRAGGQSAARHLLERGCRRIATVTGPLDQIASVDRLAGFRDVAGDIDPAFVEHGDFTAASGERAAQALLERIPDLDGLFVASDMMAAAALRAIRDSGRRVPDDVAIVGFDDAEFAVSSQPPLTTVHQDIEGLGSAMARLLLRALAPGDGAEPLEPVVIPTWLVERSST